MQRLYRTLCRVLSTRAQAVIERVRSWRHAFWFALQERLRWSRGVHRETAAGSLRDLSPEQGECVAALINRHRGAAFEQRLGERSAMLCYEYLDILDRGWQVLGLPARSGGLLCDVGCASFSYAAALQVFFRPDRLVGVEIEGHRLLRRFRSRIDHARGYVADLPNAEFLVADYAQLSLPADTITAWFPFLTAAAILAWRLPLSLLRPERLFASVAHNLKADGVFVMINHGEREANLAAARCHATGLEPTGRWQHSGAMSRYRLAPPVLTCWRRSATPTGAPQGDRVR